MKAGATDFLEKPVDDRRVVQAVRSALEEMERSLASKRHTRKLPLASSTDTTRNGNLALPVRRNQYEGHRRCTWHSIQTVAKHRTKVLEKIDGS